MEIERKWLLSTVPEAYRYYKYDVNQAYLCADTPEVRIRSKVSLFAPLQDGKDPNYQLTIKGEGTLSREEVNISIPKDKYDILRSLIPYRPIHKTYYIFPLDNNLELEVNIVDQDWIYAEVEFPDEESAQAFEFPFPECKPKEVTEETKYKMKNYWKRTRN